MDFSEIFEDKTKYGTKLKTDEYEEQGKYLIVDQGQELIAGYTDKKEGFFSELPVIIFGDHTRILKYIDQPFYIGADGVKILRCKLQNANYRYLFYALKNVYIPNTGYNRHFKWLKQSSIKYPDSVTQNKIVEILDTVSDIIQLRKKELNQLDYLIKSRFVEMFGDLASSDCRWRKEQLSDVCANPDDIKCGPFGTQLSKDEYQDAGIAVWEIPQINSLFTAIPIHYLTKEKAQQLEAYSIRPGDIAMSRKGNVGKCAVFPSDFEAGIIHSDVLRIRVDSKQVLPIFMMYQLHYSGAVRHQIELVSSGAIMAGINVTKLKKIVVHIPPLILQNQFAAFVAQVDKSKLTIQKSLDELETLNKALMQKYFGGNGV